MMVEMGGSQKVEPAAIVMELICWVLTGLLVKLQSKGREVRSV